MDLLKVVYGGYICVCACVCVCLSIGWIFLGLSKASVTVRYVSSVERQF